MLRIIGYTIEHVIGRSSKDIFRGIEHEDVDFSRDSDLDYVIGGHDEQSVYLLDIIDASGFTHTGSALSKQFQLSPCAALPE